MLGSVGEFLRGNDSLINDQFKWSSVTRNFYAFLLEQEAVTLSWEVGDIRASDEGGPRGHAPNFFRKQ